MHAFYQSINTLIPNKRQAATNSINALYKRMKLEKPRIIWCQSPWQLLVMPLLLPVMHRLVPEKAASLAGRMKRLLNANHDFELLAQVWQRIESAYKTIPANSNLEMKHMLLPYPEELAGAFQPSKEAIAARHLRADLNERIYHDAQHILMLLTTVDEEITKQYLREIYGLQAVKRGKIGISYGNVIACSDSNFRATLFYSYLQEMLSFMQFIDIEGESSACLCHKDVCFVVEPSTSCHLDSFNRPHYEKGPAITFNDGYSLYCLDGLLVEKELVEDPHWLNAERIYAEKNQEMRSLLLKRYGVENFICDSGARSVSEDAFGELYEAVLPGEQPIKFVKVVNSTPEPDGVYKDYFLRVPPWVNSAHEAVAWTFGLTEKEYGPAAQT